MWQFLLGLFIGEIAMLFLVCLGDASKKADQKAEELMEEGKENDIER